MEVLDPVRAKERSRQIRRKIRRVFPDAWDPVGVRDQPAAQDEYDSYVGRAFELLVAGATDEEIEEYLLWIAQRMGMDGSRTSHTHVIEALRAEEPKHISISPIVSFGKPVLAGTGISTSVIAGRFIARDSVADLASEYGVPATVLEDAIRWEINKGRAA